MFPVSPPFPVCVWTNLCLCLAGFITGDSFSLKMSLNLLTGILLRLWKWWEALNPSGEEDHSVQSFSDWELVFAGLTCDSSLVSCSSSQNPSGFVTPGSDGLCLLWMRRTRCILPAATAVCSWSCMFELGATIWSKFLDLI